MHTDVDTFFAGSIMSFFIEICFETFIASETDLSILEEIGN